MRIVALVAERQPILDPVRARILSGATETPTGCWEWLGTLTADGYGRVKSAYRTMLAHRASYEAFVGEIPDEHVVDHLCRNRACVNPLHLETVTLEENTRRGESPPAENARKTHCPHGHPYNRSNTYVTSRGHRDCRACRRVAA